MTFDNELQQRRAARKVYNLCGIAVVSFFVIRYMIIFFLPMMFKVIPVTLENQLFYVILEIMLTVANNLVPFFICYKFMTPYLENEKKTKLSGNFYLSSMAFMIVSAIALGLLVQAVDMLLSQVNVEITQSPTFFNNSLIFNIYGFVVTLIVAPLTEEYMFRHVLYKGFASFGGARFAIVITAVMFGMLHGNLFQAVPSTFIGLVLGYARYKSGSVWPAVILHFLYNLYYLVVTVMMAYMPTEVNSDISMFDMVNLFGTSLISILLFVFIIGFIVVVIYILAKRKISLEKSSLLQKQYSYKFVLTCVFAVVAFMWLLAEIILLII